LRVDPLCQGCEAIRVRALFLCQIGKTVPALLEFVPSSSTPSFLYVPKMIHLFPVNGNLRLGERFRWPYPPFEGLEQIGSNPPFESSRAKLRIRLQDCHQKYLHRRALRTQQGRNQGVGVEET
jgi:hypothetical protein